MMKKNNKNDSKHTILLKTNSKKQCKNKNTYLMNKIGKF